MPRATLLTLTSSSLNSDGRAPTIYIDEALPSTQMDELLLFTLTSPSLHFRWTGSFLLFTLTSPSLHIKQTGSFLQFILMSSSLNSDGRAPTIHIDEPFTAYQTDGLLPIILIDELFPQLRWTSSYYSH